MIERDLGAIARALLPERREDVIALCDTLAASRCISLVRDLRLFEVSPVTSLPAGIDPRAAAVSESLVAHAVQLGALRELANGRRMPTARMAGAYRFGELLVENMDVVALDPIGFRWLLRGLDALPSVLVGSVLAEEALFPRADFGLVGDLYAESLIFSYYSRLTEALVRAATPPLTRPLRILELGAGTGATARRVLEGVAADRVRYVFTDISPLLLSQAQAALGPRFGDRVSFEILEIEAHPWSVGSGFDVVIAQNVLHLASDVGAVLGRVHGAVAPGGTLVLSEVSPPDGGRAFPLMDYTFGLLPSFRARSGGASPLLSPEAWQEHMNRAGFVQCRFLPLTRNATAASPNYGGVHVARKPETP